MAKKRNRMANALSAPPAAATTEIKEDYSNKLVYIISERKKPGADVLGGPAGWVAVDPYHLSTRSGKLKPIPEMRFPDHLDLSNMRFHSSLVYINSKIYIIGGVYGDTLDTCPVYSPKVFSYDFTSKYWQEEPPLRRARSFSVAVAVESVIYVFGGEIDQYMGRACREEWCEFYDFKSKNGGWQFLPIPPPEAVVNNHCNFAAVHERGNQILLRVQKAGMYSFNYVTKIWSAFDPIYAPDTNNIGSLACYEVAVVEDVLFSHYFGVIYAYDLTKNILLFAKPLENPVSRFGQPLYPGIWPDWSYLVRVGKDTLLLLYWDVYSPPKKLHCYRIRIQKSSSLDDSGECAFHLLTDDCGIFKIPGVYPNMAVAV